PWPIWCPRTPPSSAPAAGPSMLESCWCLIARTATTLPQFAQCAGCGGGAEAVSAALPPPTAPAPAVGDVLPTDGRSGVLVRAGGGGANAVCGGAPAAGGVGAFATSGAAVRFETGTTPVITATATRQVRMTVIAATMTRG